MPTPFLVLRVFALFAVVFATGTRTLLARPLANDAAASRTALPTPLDAEGQTLFFSDGTGHAGLQRSVVDRVYLYGEPGTNEGTFETLNGAPDRQGWIGVDRTDKPSFWQVDTFNAETLGGHGVGNHAAWCGVSAAQEPGWSNAPGYGNNWNQLLVWTSPPLVDTSVAQTVEFDFLFHYDTEATFDFFSVEYDSAGFAPRTEGYYSGGGTSGIVLNLSGTDADGGGTFSSPGTLLSDVASTSITFSGNDYGGDNGDQIVILLRFRSDGGYSDEDGNIDTNGAVQIDDIVVRWDDGTGTLHESIEDFEGPDPLVNGDWHRMKARFSGDFSQVLPNLGDLDPCWSNTTPVMNFIDSGQEIGNAASAAEVPGTPTSTGGSVSPPWDYALPGGYVINYTGGVSQAVGSSVEGLVPLFNEVWSPPIDFDLPGTADDGDDFAGLLLEFDNYEHLPFTDDGGIFWVWEARVSDANGVWSDWRGDDSFFHSDTPRWGRAQVRFEQLFAGMPIHQIQVAVGVWDLATLFNLQGTGSTPGFYFDNVSVSKLRLGGPVLFARPRNLALGGFPPSGTLDASTVASRDALDIPIDMARDVNFNGSALVTGDSVVVKATSVIAGADIADLRLVWVLDRNPLFDSVRVPPSRPIDVNLDTSSDPDRWFGETIGAIYYDVLGRTNGDAFFDPPDEDFLHPGDVFRYYLRAEDTLGKVSTLPEQISGFTDGDGYPEEFTVRGLPSLTDPSGTQPSLLVVDYARGVGPSQQLRFLLHQLGWTAGLDYDLYRRSEGGFSLDDGLSTAGAHGAALAQLAGYQTILFDLTQATIGITSSVDLEKGDDIQLLSDWMELAGSRSIVNIGADLGGGLQLPTASTYFSKPVLGVDFVGAIGGVGWEHLSVAQAGLPLGPEFDVYGGCHPDQPSTLPWEDPSTDTATVQKLGGTLWARQLMVPVDTAFVGHWFNDATTGAPVMPASIVDTWFDQVTSDPRVVITSPVRPGEGTNDSPHPSGLLPTTEWFRALFGYANNNLDFGFPTSAPGLRKARLAVAPNPFNPRTVVSLVVPQPGHTTVTAFDARGRLVRTLYDAMLEAGKELEISWDGRDDSGRQLASGVYFVTAEAPQWSDRQKVVLLK